MKHLFRRIASAVVAAPLTLAVVFGAPAHADPASGPSTTVEMPMPGAGELSDGSDSADQPPSATLAVQAGAGGVDRDGTSGMIDPDGTNGPITGPLLRATPGIRSEPAPPSPHIRS
ncbi:MAG: hypothetical protein KIH64_003900 [Mycobacterium sp.]|nr:hypothetical protein [Mycobacterium sp.]